MLLQHKNAVIYGAGGAIGTAVARTFAREGTKVYLGGRTLAKVQEVAKNILAAGGAAEAASVDALDEQAVEKHVDVVIRKAGGIDILFNSIGMEDVQGTLLVDMPLHDFIHPIITAATTHFNCTRGGPSHDRKKMRRNPHYYGGAPRSDRVHWRLRSGVRRDRRTLAGVRGGTRAEWHPRDLSTFGRIARYTGCSADF
jgi:NAD(P)-dependent dehydrogenase (short-subunit alcohol dehydrogenase family)